MKALWIVHTDTDKEKNAEVILNKIKKTINQPLELLRFEKYYKDNKQTIYFETYYDHLKWEDFVFQILVDAQTIGYGWEILGDVKSQFDGLSKKSSISGIVQIEFQIEQ